MRGVSLMIGTPTYGGKADTAHLNSIEAFAFVLGLHAAEFGRARPDKESLVQRARNRIVREFLASRATHLLFIDADIEFTPDAPLKLLETGHECVCAAYPRKQVDWDRVARATMAGVASPELYASSAVVNLRPEDQEDGAVEFDETGCFPVLDAATGFLLMSRGLLERMVKAFPETAYVDEADDDKRTMYALFDCWIEDGPDGRKRYLSEDYGFSRRVQMMGEKVWIHPGITLNHHGSFVYRGHPDGLVFHNGTAIIASDAKAAE